MTTGRVADSVLPTPGQNKQLKRTMCKEVYRICYDRFMMQMVIFAAGASHDSSLEFPPLPPHARVVTHPRGPIAPHSLGSTEHSQPSWEIFVGRCLSP